MHELRVLFKNGEDKGYLAWPDDGSTPGVEVPFTPFLTEDDYENLRWYLEEYMDLPDGGAVTRARRIEGDLERWGRTLHDALFTARENRDLLKTLLAADEPRELTLATQDPVLLRLPWELMADGAGRLAQRVSVRRQLEEPEKTTTRAVKLPLRILYIVSRPTDTGFIDPRFTTKALFDALDPLGPSVRVDFCRPPTLARMEEMLRAGQQAGDPYDLVHFDGHGTFLPHSQIGALCFEKPDDGSGDSKADLVTADRLGTLLANYRISLVVLEACRSATVGKTAVFRSVAPRLIKAGVGSVLSMGHAVHVEAARLLLDRFYRELVRGTTIGHAVAQARSALLSTPARWLESGPQARTITLDDWFLPHLYQRDADNALVPPDAAGQPPVRQFDVFLSHRHIDGLRVEALARLLMETHGLRVWLDIWECGPGGLEPQCETGIENSRFTVVVVSQDTLKSRWVRWEIKKHNQLNPEGKRLIPIKFETLDLPPRLDGLLWVDFTDPARDTDKTAELARLIRSADAEDARRRRGYRNPARLPEEPGRFPPPPQYGFHGRARELYELERRFRTERGIVLHAMGGMGKTALATEAARHIAMVWQDEGDAARERGDEAAARRHYEAARRSAEESLRIMQSYDNKPDEALSLSQLAQIHLQLGDLAAAERHAHEARQIHESLGLLGAWAEYDTLSKIAQARGDAAAASEWAQKRDALLEERQGRAGGGGGLPAQMLKALQALTITCAQAGFGDGTLGPNEEEALAQLDQGPAPFPEFAAFLRQLAAGQLPPIPHGLPAELRQWLEALTQSIRDAPRG